MLKKMLVFLLAVGGANMCFASSVSDHTPVNLIFIFSALFICFFIICLSIQLIHLAIIKVFGVFGIIFTIVFSVVAPYLFYLCGF